MPLSGMILDTYRGNFELLKQRVELIRALLRGCGILNNSNDTKDIDRSRTKLLQAFDPKKIAQYHGKGGCRCCHYTDHVNGSPISKDDLTYLLIKDPNFQLPEPDRDSLAKNNPLRGTDCYGCLFLGARGCLLGVNRPSVCLGYGCAGAARTVLGDRPDILKMFAEKNWEARWGKEIFEKLGIQSDEFWPGYWFDNWIKPRMKESRLGKLMIVRREVLQWENYERHCSENGAMEVLNIHPGYQYWKRLNIKAADSTKKILAILGRVKESELDQLTAFIYD